MCAGCARAGAGCGRRVPDVPGRQLLARRRVGARRCIRSSAAWIATRRGRRGRCTPTSARVCGTAARSASRSPRCGAGQPRGAGHASSTTTRAIPGPYPIPSDAPIEGGACADGDRHVLVVDTSTATSTRRSTSLPAARRQLDRRAPAPCATSARNALRPAGWTSADAAGLPILPGLVRYDEVASGEIDHAIRFTAPVTRRAYVWPARHQAGLHRPASAPPMGAWFRLRADYDTSRFTGRRPGSSPRR